MLTKAGEAWLRKVQMRQLERATQIGLADDEGQLIPGTLQPFVADGSHTWEWEGQPVMVSGAWLLLDDGTAVLVPFSVGQRQLDCRARLIMDPVVIE